MKPTALSNATDQVESIECHVEVETDVQGAPDIPAPEMGEYNCQCVSDSNLIEYKLQDALLEEKEELEVKDILEYSLEINRQRENPEFIPIVRVETYTSLGICDGTFHEIEDGSKQEREETGIQLKNDRETLQQRNEATSAPEYTTAESEMFNIPKVEGPLAYSETDLSADNHISADMLELL
ncbi:hypothetical protein HDU99_009144, partial [Rhizoclosmatium hyalinum]